MEGREETPFTSETLDELTAHWRLALFAAQDALAAARAGGVSVRFGDAELGELEHKLAAERVSTTHLLEDLAKEEHVALHQRLTTPRATTRTLGLPLGRPGLPLRSRRGARDRCRVAGGGVARDLQRLPRTASGTDRGAVRPLPSLQHAPRLLPVRARPVSPRGRPYIPREPRDQASRGKPGRSTGGRDPVRALPPQERRAPGGCSNATGSTPFAGTLEYLEAAREAGVRCAVISSSSNTESMLRHAGLASLIDCVVDGRTIRAGGLESETGTRHPHHRVSPARGSRGRGSELRDDASGARGSAHGRRGGDRRRRQERPRRGIQGSRPRNASSLTSQSSSIVRPEQGGTFSQPGQRKHRWRPRLRLRRSRQEARSRSAVATSTREEDSDVHHSCSQSGRTGRLSLRMGRSLDPVGRQTSRPSPPRTSIAGFDGSGVAFVARPSSSPPRSQRAPTGTWEARSRWGPT